MSHPTKTDLKIAHFGLKVLNSLQNERRIEGDWKVVQSFEGGPATMRNFNAFANGWVNSTSLIVGHVIENEPAPVLENYTVCFGCMNEDSEPTKKTTLIYAGIPKYNKSFFKEDSKDLLRTLHWLLNDSPWSAAAITKDAEEALNVGIVVDAKCPVNLTFGILLMYKNLYCRNTPYLKIWSMLVDEGCNPSMAMLQTFGRGEFLGVRAHYSNVFGQFFWAKAPIERFLNNDPQYLSKSYYETNIYRGFGYGHNRSYNDDTVSHTFHTKKEVAAYAKALKAGHWRDEIRSPLEKEVCSLIKGSKYDEVRRTKALTSLLDDKNRTIFIDWSNEKFGLG